MGELRDYFDRQDVVNPDHANPEKLIDLDSEPQTSSEDVDQNLEAINRKREYLLLKRQKLLNLRVIDPKCGSGIGLVIALDFMLFEFEQIEFEIARLGSDIHPFSRQEMIESIAKNNLYGCDLSPECIEITKLHLWLRTVQSLQPLLDLDRNIQLGDLKNCNFGFDLTNSLILN